MVLGESIFKELRSLFRQLIFLQILWGLWVLAATAQNLPDRYQWQSVEIEGTKKIEKDVILQKVESMEGDGAASVEDIQELVRSLYALDFFRRIEIRLAQKEQEPTRLVVWVEEKPSIGAIEFEGNEGIDDEELLEASGLRVFEVFSEVSAKESLQKIDALYESQGFLLAVVKIRYEPLEENDHLKVIFDVQENEKVSVRSIDFVGNERLSDRQLKQFLATSEGGLFSYLGSGSPFRQELFDRDQQVLTLMYFNEGYLQVKFGRPSVSVTPDRKWIDIVVPIQEGKQYRVGEISFAGDLVFPENELRERLQLKSGEIFKFEFLQQDALSLGAKYGDEGYAFANVIRRTRVNEENQNVDVVFDIEKGNKVRIGRINIVGNVSTRDKVIRREMKVHEGEIYNETLKVKSQESVKRLGFFESVEFKTRPDDEVEDQIDIDVVVRERSTGSIQLGINYNSTTSFGAMAQIDEANFLGNGQRLAAAFNISSISSLFNLNFTDPYAFDTGWSLGFDLYQSRTERNDYIERRTGGALRVGYPFGEFLKGFIRYRLDRVTLDEIPTNQIYVGTDLDLFPLDTVEGTTSSVTFTLEYDRRDDRMMPSKGYYALGSIEYAGLGGDLKYAKGLSSFRFYRRVIGDLVWRNNLSYGFITSLRDDREPPFNELFLLGGPYSLRGFRPLEVGRRKLSSQLRDRLIEQGRAPDEAELAAMRPFGGEQKLLYSTELEFPLIKEANFRGVVFYDVGQAENTIDFDRFYHDVGFGFRWLTPFAPFRFEWGFPLNPDELYHDSYEFNFSAGSPF